LRSLGIDAKAQVRQQPAKSVLPTIEADIVFVDPPYRLEQEYARTLAMLAEKSPALTVIQHSVRFDPGETHGSLRRSRMLKQGDNALSFYRVA
jgi:16S rRNA G966 N2-methylase RsmD